MEPFADTHEEAKRLLNIWQRAFGFGHYRLIFQPLLEGDEDYDGAWADVFFDHGEQTILARFCPDHDFPGESLEWTVIHEMAHGLFYLVTQLGEGAEEQAVDAIARLCLNLKYPGKVGSHVGPNTQRILDGQAPKETKQLTKEQQRNFLFLVDGLPTLERIVIRRFFYENDTAAEIADDLNVSRRQVHRLRQQGVNRLRRAYAKLEETDNG